MQASLKTIRLLKDLTQKEAADMIGISKYTLGNYEKGKAFPNVPIIKKIEEAYGVEYKDIIFLTPITLKE